MSESELFLQSKKIEVTKEELQHKIEELRKRLDLLEKKMIQPKSETEPRDQIILELLNEIQKQWKATGVRAKKIP